MKPFCKVRTFAMAGLWLAASSVEAMAPRAYVSVSGNDANTCSNTATPCRTFTGAISQVTPGGEVVVLDSGTFGGGTISQAVTINAPAGVAALAATPIIVNAGASDVVTLRGITFVSPTLGSDIGLSFTGGAGLNVENCVFHGWSTGLYVGTPGKLNVRDTTVRDSSWGIFLYAGSGLVEASIERTRLLSNGFGLYVASRGKATIRESEAVGNAQGLLLYPTGALLGELEVEDCVVANNNGGVQVASVSGTIRISNSLVSNNSGVGLQQTTGVLLSRGDNTVEGNGTNAFGTIGAYSSK